MDEGGASGPLVGANRVSLWRDPTLASQRNINGYRLVLTCSACPEQYDVFLGEAQVAYLRLRHGEFRAHVPDSRGVAIFEAEAEGDGMFEPGERERLLTRAVEAIEAQRLHGARSNFRAGPGKQVFPSGPGLGGSGADGAGRSRGPR